MINLLDFLKRFYSLEMQDFDTNAKYDPYAEIQTCIIIVGIILIIIMLILSFIILSKINDLKKEINKNKE